MKKLLSTIVLLGTMFIQADDFDIDNMLNDIEKKTDLSEKTKLANSGVSFIYTRDDMDRMQIHSLKDILKSIYPIGYNENRYGVADPFSQGTNHPFMSSLIKVFIDNQEISVGLYGSGLSIMADLGIQWVDHMEVYTRSPTYEYSTESTLILIKLYTKSAKKDDGGSVGISSDSYGSLNLNTHHSKEFDKWQYFSFLEHSDKKRKKYKSNGSEVSRDNNTNLVVATLNKENHNILLLAKAQKNDGFLDISLDGSPETSTIDVDFIHLGYDTKVDDFLYLLSYDYMNMKTLMTDNNSSLYRNETETTSEVFTGEFKYNLKTTKNNIITGVKYRAKKYSYDKSILNNAPRPTTNDNDDLQTISTIFFENQYSLENNSIITVGSLYSIVKNNHSVQDDNMFMYRLGHTYTIENFTFKTIGSHTKTTLDPYLINSDTFLATPTEYYEPEEINSIVENIIYQYDNNKYELILGYTISKNHLIKDVNNKYNVPSKSNQLEKSFYS
ncbi:MAG: hypothetical protein U9N59_11310 [Campylobacterota bacterium]|nr:hypothetical protein [Campylobacterota bacterium]